MYNWKHSNIICKNLEAYCTISICFSKNKSFIFLKMVKTSRHIVTFADETTPLMYQTSSWQFDHLVYQHLLYGHTTFTKMTKRDQMVSVQTCLCATYRIYTIKIQCMQSYLSLINISNTLKYTLSCHIMIVRYIIHFFFEMKSM